MSAAKGAFCYMEINLHRRQMQTLNAPSKIYYAKKSTPCCPVDASVVVDATCWDVTCSFVVLDVTVVCVGGSNEECRWRAEIYKTKKITTFDVLFSQFLALNERNSQDRKKTFKILRSTKK